MRSAKDYIVFPLDLPTVEQAAGYVRRLADDVGMFKVGLELFVRGGARMIRLIREESDAGIFLDLKLHDIPETVRRAMEQIAGWQVSYTTVHCGESPAMLEAAVAGSRDRVGVLGVTVLTSVSPDDIRHAGFLAAYADNLSELVIKRADMAKVAGCAGVVCSGHEVAVIRERFGNDFVTMVPGIRPAWTLSEKDDQQRVVTPAQAVARGADYVVIGRPIRDAEDPSAAAEMVAAEIEEGMGYEV
ncbi:MAG: orotidine-5'-phosphate decarboxylase [Thermodesulfobacteriota bacterium]